MLVLSRNKGEKIMIADNIIITIVDVRGKTVRVGIEAPKEIPVDREEIRVAKTSVQSEPAETIE